MKKLIIAVAVAVFTGFAFTAASVSSKAAYTKPVNTVKLNKEDLQLKSFAKDKEIVATGD